jgi:hypothetical protein
VTRPYRPSNGTEGLDFQDRVCAHCARYGDCGWGTLDCRKGLIDRSMLFDVDDPEYPKEWVYTESGAPTCTAWKKKRSRRRPIVVRQQKTDQLELLGGDR